MLKKGVSIIEVLMVLSLISILVIIFITNLYLPRQFARARNLERESEIRAIQIAVNQYRMENNGQFPSGLTNSALMICKPGCTINSSKVDISSDISEYIDSGEIPVDPEEAEASDETGYSIYIDPQGNIIVEATKAENDVTIRTE